MSPHLHVQVRLRGALVEDRLVEVRREVWLGSREGAAVAFPDGDLTVRATGSGLALDGGVALPPGAPVVRAFGPVEVRLEAADDAAAPRRDASWLPDPILVVATITLLLADAFYVQFGDRFPWGFAAEAPETTAEAVAPTP